MRVFHLLITLTIFLVGVAFALFNAGPVTIRYFTGSAEVSLTFVLLLAFIFGVIITIGVLYSSLIRLKYRNRRLHSKLENLEKQVANLKDAMVKDS